MASKIDNPADVACISARPYGQRAVLKFAAHTGGQLISHLKRTLSDN